MQSEDFDFYLFLFTILIMSALTVLTIFGNFNNDNLTFTTQINKGNNIKVKAELNNELRTIGTPMLEDTLEQLVFEKTFNKNYNINRTKEVIKEIIQNEIKKEEYGLDSNLKVINIEIFPVKSEKRI